MRMLLVDSRALSRYSNRMLDGGVVREACGVHAAFLEMSFGDFSGYAADQLRK